MTKRQDAATATVGLAGVGGAGALRHQALVSAYHEKTKFPIKRPRLLAERRLITHHRGRGRYALATGLGLVAVPAAATGVSNLLSKADEQKRSFVGEGLRGARSAVHQRVRNVAERPPAKLTAANYAAGLGVTALGSSLTHRGLRHAYMPGGAKSAAAAVAGTLAGVTSLPVQSKLTHRYSHGRYEVTPTGVRRAKKPRVPASTKAGRDEVGKAIKVIVHGRMPQTRAERIMHPHPPVSQAEIREAYKQAGFKTSAGKLRKLHLEELQDAQDTTGSRGRFGGLGMLGAGLPARGLSHGLSRHRRYQISKRNMNDPGANMSRGERRLRVSAAPPIPVAGDIMGAATAARLSPPKYRKRTAVQQYGATAGGGLAGNVGGALGAAALADRSSKFRHRAEAANAKVEDVKARARQAVHLPESSGPGMGAKMLEHQRTPGTIKRAARALSGSRPGRLLARRPGVAAIGGLVGGTALGTVTTQGMYSHIMNRDDRYRAANRNARHGSRVSKLDSPKPLSQREHKQLRRRKNQSAIMSAISGTTGLAALGSTLASSKHSPLKAAHKARIGRLPVPLLTTGAGVSGVNAFRYAQIQRREANTPIGKRLPADKAVMARLAHGRAATHAQYPRGRRAMAHVKADDLSLLGEHRKTVMRLRPTGGRVMEEWLTTDPRTVGKALGRVLAPTGRRIPGMRTATIRQVRTATGIKTSSVRGGLIR